MQHAWGNELCIAFAQETPTEGHFIDPGIDRWMTLKLIFKKQDGITWIGLIWLIWHRDMWQTTANMVNLWVW
jgi:hypothetical protein